MSRPFLRSREQGRLADPRLAANDERAAAVLDSVDQGEELGQIRVASEERLCRGCDSDFQ
jgi:hypothetical protein